MSQPVKHIVLFRPGNEVAQAALASMFSKVATMSRLVDGNESVFIGHLEEEYPLARGFTYGMVLSFASQQAVNAFVESSEYQPLIREMQKLFDINNDILVVNLPGNYTISSAQAQAEAESVH